MTPKEYFEQVFDLEKKIDTRMDERDAVLQTVIGATPMQENPTYSNQFNSTTENTVMKLLAYNDQANEYVGELVHLQIKMSHEISQLPKFRHQMVLRQRYLCSKEFKEIAKEQNYSETRIYSLHKEALNVFKEKFPNKFSKVNS